MLRGRSTWSLFLKLPALLLSLSIMTPLAAVLTILELLTCLNRHVGRMVLWDTLLAFFPDICLFGITCLPQAGPSISYHIKRNVQAVTSSSEKGGVILIMHTPNANNRTNTIFVVDGILSILNGRGFKGCTIEEALQEKV